MGAAPSAADGSGSTGRDTARGRRICCCAAEETARLLADNDENGTAQEPSEQVASVIQFSCPMFFCKEDEGVVKVDVVRFGDATNPAQVNYHTEDSSAKAGKKYMAQSGTLRFEAHETLKVLDIEIINDDSWDATLEFSVKLSGARGAQLGLYLHSARVKIIDDDSFPTNKYAEYFSEDREEEIPSLGLFIEFCKMNMLNPLVFWSTWKTIFLDQVKNVYFLLTLYLQMYLIDVVLESETEGQEHKHESEGPEVGEESADRRRLLLRFIHVAARRLAEAMEAEPEGEEEEASSLIPKVLLIPGNRAYTAIVVGVIYIVPFVLLHCIDIKKLSWTVAGNSRAHLQTNLMRKFLNYQEEHRARISMGDLQMTMVRDVTEVVNFGFMKLLMTLAICGKLTLALVFILAENKMAVVPLAVYPVVMGVFLCCRGRVTVETCEAMAQKQNDVVSVVGETAQSYRLIADFFLRPFVVDTYEEELCEFNQREVSKTMVAMNNMYLPPWLTTILIGVYMMTAPLQVVTFGGPLTLGAFLATINIFKEVGVELAEIYHEIMEIQMSIGPLRKLCHFMNLETDLESRMAVSRARRDMGNTKRMAARKRCSRNADSHLVDTGSMVTTSGEEVFAVDIVSIDVNNLTFAFGTAPPILNDIHVSFDQGKLYALVGPPHEGKSTFLKLLGQVLLPSEGDAGYVFVPPHLRVLHLSQETFVMSSSLLKNLVFNTDVKKVGGLDRVKRICKLLRFPTYMLDELSEPKSKEAESAPGDSEGPNDSTSYRNWLSRLSYTDFARLNLARAFVMNPECLVLHKPALAFDDAEKLNVVQLLRRCVDHKGLELPDENRKFRRRRTIFFSCVSIPGIQIADSVYEVSKQNGVSLITKEKALAALRDKGEPDTS